MAGCDQCAFLKVLELVLCICCLLFKWLTDYEASRLFFLLEKQSREWPLLNNVTWNQSGSWFADVTFGGYTIICLALLIAQCAGELKKTRKTESFLLGIGGFLFIAVGMMVLSSFDNVPDELIDNALILGSLSLLTGFVFLLDVACLSDRGHSSKSRFVEETLVVKEKKMAISSENVNGMNKTMITNKNGTNITKKEPNQEEPSMQEKMISELRSSIKKSKTNKYDTDTTDSPVTVEEVIEKKDVQHGRRYLENRGFPLANEKWINDKDFEDVKHGRRYLENRRFPLEDEKWANDEDIDYKTEEDPKIGSQEKNQTPRKVLYAPESKYEKPHRRDVQTLTDSVQEPLPPTSNTVRSLLLSNTVHHSSTANHKFEPSTPVNKGNSVSNGSIGGVCLCPKNCKCKISSPTSPRDPGYVLHTASKWPFTTPLSPESYKKHSKVEKLKDGREILHSDV